jgi:SAM-dependent methyltransferase
MNTEIFSGKADAYAKARPGYPEAAMDFIASILPQNAVIADVGAGTGKFAVLLAQRGYRVFAVEPNADMRRQLVEALSPYQNATIIDGSAEATTLPVGSVDAVTCAQALHWFDPDAFWAECRRIAKGNTLVIAVYNNTPGGGSIAHSKLSTDAFFTSPAVREFPNPIYYTRESWLSYMTSHSHDPLPTDAGYAAHIADMNAAFDKEQVDGLLLREVVTKVYSEVSGRSKQMPMHIVTRGN